MRNQQQKNVDKKIIERFKKGEHQSIGPLLIPRLLI